jgi:membrane-bound serine protease (ClpP class)
MDPISLIFLLIVLALVLLAAEAFLPTHGVLGVAGVCALVGAVAIAFVQNAWVGVGLLVGSVVASPFVFKLMVAMWERSPVGRRVMLTAVTGKLDQDTILVGDIGTTVSELRPMGSAEFGPITVQVTSLRDPIRPGVKVRVVGVRDGVASVEPIAQAADSLSEGSSS